MTRTIEINERCDRCGASAYMVAENGGRILYFCLHHAKEHIASLERAGWELSYDFAAIERIVPAHAITT